MKASEQQALIPQEATPDTLIDLIGKTQQVTNAAAVVLKACRTVMDTRTKKEHIDKWGGIHAITEAVYDEGYDAAGKDTQGENEGEEPR